MSDNKSKTVADRKRINVHEDHELRYWSHRFGVSRDELKRAVNKFGVMADDVLAHLVGLGGTQPRHPTMLPNRNARKRLLGVRSPGATPTDDSRKFPARRT